MNHILVTVKKEGNVTKYKGRRCIPPDIANNKDLQEAIKYLPQNYNFEIEKTLWRIRELKSHQVALQMPEGLFIFACTIADILERFSDNVEVIIMADVIYGACCVDDYTASALGADLLVHYGHSCLVPVDQTSNIRMLYVFVDIAFDVDHLVETIRQNFPPQFKLAVMSTIQFIKSLHRLVTQLPNYHIVLPQSKPLSSCEVLGCTAPNLDGFNGILYVGDGRFHSEALMIANPKIQLYNYNPYSREIKKEYYNYDEMVAFRTLSVNRASSGRLIGLVLGTLGRQGSPKVLEFLAESLKKAGRLFVVVLISELSPQRLEFFGDSVDMWIQVACPRLAIDWGKAYRKPLLTPYEGMAMIGRTQWKDQYPMDYYAAKSLGPWTPNFVDSVTTK